MKNKRVVITGIGPICSLGVGCSEVFKNLQTGSTYIKDFDNYVFGKYYRKFKIHKVRNFRISKFALDNEILKEMKNWKDGEEVQDLYYILGAIKLALIDSGITEIAGNRTGVVLAHENPGLEQFCSFLFTEAIRIFSRKKKTSKFNFFNDLNYKVAKNVNDLQTFMFLFYVTRIFKLHGYSLFVNNACASGLYALESARQIINSGLTDVMIIASSEHPAIYKYLWFERMRFLSPSGITRPFDTNRDGFICGEGGTAFVLEEYEHAVRRNARIYAEYLGGGFSQECWKRTVPSVLRDFRVEVINKAIKTSMLQIKDIDVISAHGLGSKLIDQVEALAIEKLFASQNKKPFVTAYKPYVGHTLGNCALLETAILLLGLHNNIVHPIMNLVNLDPSIKINVVRERISSPLGTALKFVWGFGGFNAAAVFKKINK